MKYLNKYNTVEEMSHVFFDSLNTPNVSYCKEGEALHYTEKQPEMITTTSLVFDDQEVIIDDDVPSDITSANAIKVLVEYKPSAISFTYSISNSDQEVLVSGDGNLHGGIGYASFDVVDFYLDNTYTVDVNIIGGDPSSTTILATYSYLINGTYEAPKKAESIAVDLDLPSGLKWAAGNVGAENPEDAGLYFAWGETEGYAGDAGHNFAWANYKWSVGGSSSNFSKYNTTGATLELEDDAARANLGGSWRMPTSAEIDELINNTTRTWTTNYDGTGVAGYIVKSKTNSNQIFMPAAGYCDGTSLDGFGSNGNYWSSSRNSGNSSYGYYLDFIFDDFDRGSDYRYYGHSVRGVCE